MNRIVVTALLLVCGCYGEFEPPAQSDASTTVAMGSTSVVLPSTTSSSSSGTTEAQSSSTGSSSSSSSSTSGAQRACTGVDLLFVVDRSDSMDAYANALASLALQGTEILDQVEEIGEFHVGITLNAIPRSNAGAISLPESPTPDEPYDCQDIGALIRPNTAACGTILNGLAYATNEVSSVLQALQCLVLAEGNDGPDSENTQTVQTLSQAIAPTNAEVSACNEGFRDPDHALVVVVVTDSDEPTPLPNLASVGFRTSVGRGLAIATLTGNTRGCATSSTQCDAAPACNLLDFIDAALLPSDPPAINADICTTISSPTETVQATVDELIAILPEICS